MHVVITGGCGFIGSHLVERILKSNGWSISVLDGLSYASRGLDRLHSIKAFDYGRVQVFPVDLSRPLPRDVKRELGKIDAIVHMAAEVHVDKSIADPERFVQSNIMGTFQMLELAREFKPSHFLYFSTDEVFGPATDGVAHKDWDRYNSANPYSATKAAGEELALAWANTYGVPLTITHCTNVFGERQNPEAFIPSTIGKVLYRERVRIHTNAAGVSGARFYIHAGDVAAAVMRLLDTEPRRDKFNITSDSELTNMDVALAVAEALAMTFDFDYVSTDRPGCDFRYALDGSKLRALGWKPAEDFDAVLERVVGWYAENQSWLKRRSAAVFKEPRC